MEKRFAGPRAITLEGLMSGNLDITRNQWAHQVIINIIYLSFFICVVILYIVSSFLKNKKKKTKKEKIVTSIFICIY